MNIKSIKLTDGLEINILEEDRGELSRLITEQMRIINETEHYRRQLVSHINFGTAVKPYQNQKYFSFGIDE